MNRRSILILSAIAALGPAVLPGSAIAQTKSLKDQLVGTWTVTSQEQARKDGSKVERFGATPKGITIFEANGRFATILARPDLPKLASNDPMKPSPRGSDGAHGRLDRLFWHLHGRRAEQDHPAQDRGQHVAEPAGI